VIARPADGGGGPRGEGQGRNPSMHDGGKSDGPVVPAKPPNKPAFAEAEAVEERGPAEGNTAGKPRPGRRAGTGVSRALDRVRQVAANDRKARFTALLHHVTVERLEVAYRTIRRGAAPGVDEVTWHCYGQQLEANLHDLHARVQRGAYRASPSRRAYIPKADGGLRPLGIAALEDKIVQRAVAEVLNAVYEADFLGFSYGFRPRRSPHDALGALAVAIVRKRVNWVLDADICGFFDTIDHGWLAKFVKHRIADERVLRLIQKWLRAGVIEDGVWTASDEGTPQGASISALLANVYLHYVFDLWVHQWRSRHAHGDVVVVRYADDFVVGFERRADAERFWADLRDRFAAFGLRLHPDKTRLIEFGRFAAERRQRRGDGKPETFDFLGFTHICAKTRNERFKLRRVTSKKRMTAKLRAVKAELMRRRHEPIPIQGRWLASVIAGHVNYYGVPDNSRAIQTFRWQAVWLWRRALSRRSQRAHLTWERMDRLVTRWLPPARVARPWPQPRYAAAT
jgi:RNA-directed DNA polymerase